MNSVKATIAALDSSGSITLVRLKSASEIALQLLLIDTPATAPYLKMGTEVTALFKETQVILARPNCSEIIIPNKIPAKINKLETAHFLTRVHLDSALGKLSALVHNGTLKSMGLKQGDAIIALIKMNEIMLSP